MPPRFPRRRLRAVRRRRPFRELLNQLVPQPARQAGPLNVPEPPPPPPPAPPAPSARDRSPISPEDAAAAGPSQPRARRRSSEDHDGPPAKMARRSGEDTDGETCPICYEPWTSSGPHRLVCLKCGHCFGASCVWRWLTAKPVTQRACPTCKTRCTVRDIRPLYARRLATMDNSQTVAVENQITGIQAENSRLEAQVQRMQNSHRAALRQLEVVKRSLSQWLD